jgi:hypothetical protein
MNPAPCLSYSDLPSKDIYDTLILRLDAQVKLVPNFPARSAKWFRSLIRPNLDTWDSADKC